MKTKCVSQPEAKTTKRVLSALQSQFAYLGRRTNAGGKNAQSAQASEEVAGEYQTILEQEFFDFVLFEVPWISF